MCYPQKVHLGITLAAIVCIIAGSMVPYGFAFIFVWMILGNIIAYTLKCEKCGKRLATTKWNGARGWGWGICDHCGHHQKK